MVKTRICLVAPAFLSLLATAQIICAQERSTDNAVTQADDAFGYSVGRESIGIYSSNNTRGFSPSQAGNIRLEGLYFDNLYDPNSALIDSVSLKVGLAAQGYPFAAPSGIVDLTLRRPSSTRGASIVVNTDSFGTAGAEINGSLPLSSKLQIGYGLTGGASQFPDGTSDTYHGQALIARWQPNNDIEIIPFWSLYNDYNNQSGTFFVTDGAFLPPAPPYNRFDGPAWAGVRYTGGNQGLLTTVTPAKNWTIRVGLFRSVFDQYKGFTNLLVDVKPDGTGQRITAVDPRAIGRSISGELRVSHSINDGPRFHLLQLSLRGRDARREFGGTAEVDLGPGRIGQIVSTPQPTFAFGPLSTGHVRQTNIGLSYDGRWKNVGEISVSIGRSDYRDDTRQPGVAPAIAQANPLIGNAIVAIQLTSDLVAYAGYARGLEQSGVAPATAANRNQPLQAILTSQYDAGLRWTITGDIKLVAGVFDLRRPYFNFDDANVFTQVGSIRSRGVELSINGHLTKTLTVVAGGYFLDPRVERTTGTSVLNGKRPVGLRTHFVSLNLNWETPIKGVALDLTASHRSRIAATADNAVYLPPHLEIAPGARYGFKLAGHNATARVQIENLIDDRYFGLAGPGIYLTQPRLHATAYIAIDL